MTLMILELFSHEIEFYFLLIFYYKTRSLDHVNSLLQTWQPGFLFLLKSLFFVILSEAVEFILLLKAPPSVKRRRICLFVKQMPEQKLIRGGSVQPGLHFSRFFSPVDSKYHLWKEVGVFTQAARTQRARMKPNPACATLSVVVKKPVGFWSDP